MNLKIEPDFVFRAAWLRFFLWLGTMYHWLRCDHRWGFWRYPDEMAFGKTMCVVGKYLDPTLEEKPRIYTRIQCTRCGWVYDVANGEVQTHDRSSNYQQ